VVLWRYGWRCDCVRGRLMILGFENVERRTDNRRKSIEVSGSVLRVKNTVGTASSIVRRLSCRF
jgi:hypothetical protein